MTDVMHLFGKRLVGCRSESDCPLGKGQEPGERSQKSRFSGAIRARDGQTLACLQREGEVRDDDPATAFDGEL